MSKFVISGKLDYAHVFKPTLPYGETEPSGSYRFVISEIFGFKAISGDATFGSITGTHLRPFANIHGVEVDGLSLVSKAAPVVTGVDPSVFKQIEAWNCGIDRFLNGLSATVVASEYESRRDTVNRTRLAPIAVRITQPVALPTDDEFWDMMQAENASAAYAEYRSAETTTPTVLDDQRVRNLVVAAKDMLEAAIMECDFTKKSYEFVTRYTACHTAIRDIEEN